MVDNRKLRLHWLWLTLGLLYVLYILYVSLMPSPPTLVKSDKAAHFLGYLVLMGWFSQIYSGVKVRILLALLFILLGVCIEFLQGLGGVRMFEFADMVANGFGVLVAWVLSYTPMQRGLAWFERGCLRLNQKPE
jgi:VanZ family protein